jgi:acyl dehydratase
MSSVIRFPVEASHVLMFARAVGDPNALFVDPERARALGYSDVLAPPTFSIAADHFDPDYERRPSDGEVWFGSGAEAISRTGGSQQSSGAGSGFHAEECFVYHRPIVVGDVLHGSRSEGRHWQKSGRRGGGLRFSEEILEYRDAAGMLVLTSVWVNVTTERVVGGDSPTPVSTATSSPPAPGDSEPSADDATDWTLLAGVKDVELAGAKLAVGEVREQQLVEDLKRTQIVMYAGASGDFHPMHTDATYAAAMGMPGVFAHGMLTMGIAGRALTDLAGAGMLADYRARFQGQVWPGDTLTARSELVSVCERAGRRCARLDIAVRNQRDETVLSGRAHAWAASQA